MPECVTCGSGNRDDARFCAQCGAALSLVCESCGRDLAPDARFCDGCGTPVAGGNAAAPAPPTTSEGAVRKTVTVLFADLGGSTGFGERTDPETARAVMARYYDLLRTTVEGHGGTVAKFTGDGVMAVWGIPEIAEDDAARAVAAGAVMQERFGPFADEVEALHGERLTFRIGINTGEVVIADTDADMVGDALNVAARLEKECAPGHVLVGEETWRLTRGTMSYESLGSVTVSGRAEAVGIHQLITSDAADVATDEATPFVGRDREVARLQAVFDDARATTSPRFVTVLGSPGVGKTRLAREFTSSLGDDVTVLEARCDRAGEATFAPIVDLIRNAVELDGLDDRASRDAIDSILGDSIDSDERRRIVDVVVGLLGTAPARSTEETFWALRRMVESVAGEGGLVLVIDDIQWAESLLLDLLEHLAEWVSGTAFVLVGLARPELRDLRPGLTEIGARTAEVLALDGLDAAATEELAAKLLGTDRLPTEIVERLPASTDGNPLFVRELVRMLVDDHVIERAADGWELAIDADAVEVPPTIQSLLAARVERLPADERTVLESASVIGSEFNLGALRELAEQSQRNTLLDVLERLRRKELVEPAGTYWGDEPVHRFHHVLIRDAAYRRLLKAKRADLHERVARWTDDAARALAGEHEAAIAHHYEQAHDYLQQLGSLDERGRALGERAAELLITAADRALGREDLPAAGGLSARAVALSGDDRPLTEAALLIACEALLAAGDVRTAAPLVKRLSALAGDDRRLDAWATCFDAQVIVLTDPDRLAEAETAVTAAATALADLDDQAGLAKAHLVRAGILARLGQVGACEVELDLALGAARTVDDHRRVTAVLGAAPAAALWGPSPLARAGGRCLDVVRLLRITAASPSVEASSMRTQAVLEALRGRFDTARSMLERSRAPLAELGLQHGLLEADLFAGIIELIAGDPVMAEPLLRAAYGGLGALGVGADAGQAAALLAGSLLAQGRIDEADEMAAASEAMAGQNLKTGVAWRAARAQILSAAGDHDRAVSIAEDAVRIAEPTDLLLDHADACMVLARVRDAAGDRAGAAAAREEAGRLYRAKGATTLGDRVADQKGANEPQSAGQRPSAPDNEATKTARQLVRQWMAGDLDAALDRYADDYEFVDRRQGLTDRSSGRDAMREQFEVILELLDGDQFEVFDVVEQRGEHLTLFTQGVNGKIQLEMLSLMEFDTAGHATYACIYDMADIDVAIADLDARYRVQRASPGASVSENLATRGARETLLRWMAGDLQAARTLFVDDAVMDDRRRGLGNTTTGADGVVDQLRVIQDLLEGQPFEIFEVVEQRGEHLTLIRQGVHGEVHVEMLFLSEVVPDGRAIYGCMYDIDDVGRAVADLEMRYRAHGESSVVGQVDALSGENLASRALLEHGRAWRGGDRAGMVAACGEPFERINHRTPRIGPAVMSVGQWVDSLLSFHAVGLNLEEQAMLAVRGRHLALGRGLLRNDDGDELEGLWVAETDAAGLIVRIIDFDADAFLDAYTELAERYAAGEGAAHAELIRLDLEWTIARHNRDWSRLSALAADDAVYVDHRPLRWGTGDWSTYLANEQSHADLIPDVWQVCRVQLADGDTLLALVDAIGTWNGEVTIGSTIGVVQTRGAGPDRRAIRLDFYEEDDAAQALARFHELTDPQPVPPTQQPLLAAENDTTRTAERQRQAFEANDRAAMVALYDPSFERIDRRSGPIGPPVTSLEDYVDRVLSFREVGFLRSVVTSWCVRGDRLALFHIHSETDTGDVYEALQLGETGDDGRIVRIVDFSADALVDAYTELSERYAIGEGVEHAEQIRTDVEWTIARHRRDWARLTELAADDMVYVDHRPLKWGSGDWSTYLANEQSHVEVMPDLTVVPRVLRHEGDAALCVADMRGTEPGGVHFTDTLIAVSTTHRSGSELVCDRIEMFDVDAYDQALTRFHELNEPTKPASSHDPLASENLATRAFDRARAAWSSADRDELVALFGPGFEHVARRFTPAGPYLVTTVDEWVEQLLSFHGVGLERPDAAVLCVRGDRLALHELRLTSERGDEYVALELTETDADGRIVRNVTFEPDAFAAAYTELAERYAAAEGAEHAEKLRLDAAFVRARQTQEWDALAALVTDDFVVVDHRPLRWGTGGIDTFLANEESHFELMPDLTVVHREVQYEDGAEFCLADVRGTEPSGHPYAATTVALATTRPGPPGLRFDRLELFDGDEHDDALARFHELAAASKQTSDRRILTVENLATRAAERGASNQLDGFDRVEATPWCVRGDRLALVHLLLGNDAGHEVAVLQLVETDNDGLVVRAMDFDADAFAAAYAELAEWYATGEGAEHAEVIRLDAAMCIARQEQDWESFSSALADDFVYIDHRPLRWGTGDRDILLANEQSHFEVMPDLRVVNRAVRHVGDAGLSVADVVGTDPGGVLAKHTLLVVSTVRRVGSDLVCSRCEAFGEDDIEAALARLDELGGPSPPTVVAGFDGPAHGPDDRPPTHPPDWDRVVRFRDLMAAGSFDEAADLLDPEFTRVDRRRGVSDGVADRAAYIDAWRAMNDVGLRFAMPEPVAWRGEALALLTVRFATAAGDELAMLSLNAAGPTGLTREIFLYDIDDLATAMRDLDDRYLAGEGAEHADVIGHGLRMVDAYADRDWPRLASLRTDDFEFVDHRPLSWGRGDKHLLETNDRSMTDTILDMKVVITTLEANGSAMLSTIRFGGTTTAGVKFERALVIVTLTTVIDGSVLATRQEYFGDDQYAQARARFAELARTSGNRPPTHPPRWARTLRFRELMAAGAFDEAAELLDPEFTRVDRRWGISGAVADRAAFLDAWRALNDVGFELAMPEPVAWRGERLSLFTTRYVTARGDEMAMLTLWADGSTGKLRDVVLYDADDVATAMRDLDDRYLAGEGAEDADAIDLGLRDLDAYTDRDWPRRADLRTDDFEIVDHRPLSWGRGDKHLLEINDRSLAESMADVLFVMRTHEVNGTAGFATFDLRGTTTAGVPFERTLFGLSAMTVVDGSLLISRNEYFDEDQYLEARARFDELARSTEPAAPNRPPGRAEGFERFRADIAAGRVEEAKAFLHPDFVRIDRRRGSQTPTVDGEGYIASLAAAEDVGLQLTSSTHLAARGDRLELVRARFESPAGDEMVTLAVQQFEDERAIALVAFDDDDLADALVELEDRYASGEGAADADVVRFLRDVFQARLARDVDQLAVFYAEEFTYVDHRQLGWATGDRDTYLADERAQLDLLPQLTVVPRTLQIDGDAAMITADVHGVTAEGVEYDRVTVSVCGTRNVGDDRVFTHGEYFDEEQLPLAHTRFAELARWAGGTRTA